MKKKKKNHHLYELRTYRRCREAYNEFFGEPGLFTAREIATLNEALVNDGEVYRWLLWSEKETDETTKRDNSSATRSGKDV